MIENPILHYRPTEPPMTFEDCENFSCSITEKINAIAADTTERVIVDAIVDEAKRQGVTDLYILDRKWIMDAITEKARREGRL